MLHNRDALIAYLATLFALVTIFIGALVAASITHDIIGKLEAFGLGTITGGLIGVLRIPSGAQSNPQADANLATALDKLPPPTIGTGNETLVEPEREPGSQEWPVQTDRS